MVLNTYYSDIKMSKNIVALNMSGWSNPKNLKRQPQPQNKKSLKSLISEMRRYGGEVSLFSLFRDFRDIRDVRDIRFWR